MVSIYLDGSYKSSNPTWHVEDCPWKARQIGAILKKHNVNPDSICEVGCGTGEILARLRPTFPETHFFGYEVSPQAYDICKRKQSNRMQFRFEDLTAQTDVFFDVVLAIDVLEHVEDYFGFVKGLKDRGRLKIFHIPLDLSVQSVLRMKPILSARQKVGHLHYFIKETAIATLVESGYKIIDQVYTPSRLELPNQTLSSKLMKLPRRLFHRLNPDLNVRVLGGYSLLVLAT
jgi:2-polyprenyl-3-methyl-5-hydroxy-6-metoxy-1,4-benzoquinol methylase